MRVHLYPSAHGEDDGQGGVRRVVEYQQRYLPALGVELVDDPELADVIACHITIPDTYLKRFPDKAFVAHCHGLYWSEYEWPNWALKANGQVMEAIRVADAVTAPSEWVARIIRRHASRPVAVVNHGVDPKEWARPKPLGYVLWDKTRPDPICDPEPLNEAARRLPGIQFVGTFGDDSLPNLRLTGRVSYEESRKLTLGASVYLATSRETFGIATLQALAAGVPVVGWDWGGTAEILAGDRADAGRLVTPGDYQALADAITHVLDNREEFSAAARLVAKEFGWREMCRGYVEVYEEALRRRTAPVRTTVLVTAYNLAQYLPACLDSVAAQTDPDWECVVVDDASPDACGQIADEYAARETRFRVIHNDRNLYLAGARNVGVSSARGRYVLPLDADDMLPPDAVRLLADELDRDRSIHVAYGNVSFLEADGREWRSGWPMPFRWEWQVAKRNLLPYSSIFRREAWEWTGGYRTRCRTAEDADFWTRLSSYGFRPKMVTSADTLIYRNREGSMSRSVGDRDWQAWFPWSVDHSLSPAGAVAEAGQLPIPSLDPPVIAIVIPVGPGHGRFVSDAVDSVEAQTFRQWECIVVNDSGEPLPPLPVWVRIIQQPETRRYDGVAAARNAGIAASSARLFLPLDADDLLQPDCLRAMLQVHRETGSAVYADFWEDPKQEGDFTVFRTPDFDARLLITSGLPWAVTTLTPRTWWVEAGGYDESIPNWEDWAFALRLAELGKCFVRVAAPLWTYRKHTGARRNENLAARDRGETAIRARFGRYWEGDQLMACGCSNRQTSTFSPEPPAASAPVSGSSDEQMLLVTYTGERLGDAAYRGASGTVYYFSAGASRYVLADDVGMFEGKSDFRIEQPQNIAAASDAPVLIAEGPPA